MNEFNLPILKKFYIPKAFSHKGQNGKLLVIGGSKLFHAASLWALEIASRIVDMVFYSSVSENNKIVQELKKEFRNGIVIPRTKVEDYIREADCILIGPGLPRKEGQEKGDDDTQELTEKLLLKYPEKKWVIDGGSLQEMDPEVLLKLKTIPILTPHHKEFDMLKLKSRNTKVKRSIQNSKLEKQLKVFAKEYNCVVLLKGETDIVCGPPAFTLWRVKGGNAGMTKGGTGDVLAGLTAALYTKNDAFVSAVSGSYINKKAGESLYKRVGFYFNTSDLVKEIPKVMKELIL